MTRYFQVKVPIAIPSVATTGQHTAFADTDVLFDWTSFELPRHGAKLINVGMITRAKGDAGTTVNEFPVDLLFSSTNTRSLGTLNDAPPDNLAHQRDLQGHVEIVAGNYVPDLDSHSFADTSRVEGNAPNIVLVPDATVTSVPKTMYVGGIAKGAFDFESVCRSTAAKTTSDVAIAVDGVDARKLFAVGDTLVNTTTADTSVQTALGKVSVVAENAITFESTLEASVADNDFIYNKYPITLILSFEM